MDARVLRKEAVSGNTPLHINEKVLKASMPEVFSLCYIFKFIVDRFDFTTGHMRLKFSRDELVNILYTIESKCNAIVIQMQYFDLLYHLRQNIRDEACVEQVEGKTFLPQVLERCSNMVEKAVVDD